jgi:hypothetical protein
LYVYRVVVLPASSSKLQYMFIFFLVSLSRSEDLSASCPHQYFPQSSQVMTLGDNEGVDRMNIEKNSTKMFLYENSNFMNSNILFKLELCSGGPLTLFIRRTRPCWPDPWNDKWYHFKGIADYISPSVIFDLPKESTKWYIAVYSPDQPSVFRLQVITDIEKYPRLPVDGGILNATQISGNLVNLKFSKNLNKIDKIKIYSSLQFDSIRNPKVYNSVCGLETNTDQPYAVMSPSDICDTRGECQYNITQLIPGKKYLFNVVSSNSEKFFNNYNYVKIRINEEYNLIDSIISIFNYISIFIGTIIIASILILLYLIQKYKH